MNLLGYIVFPDFRRLRNDNGFRFQRRLRKMAGHYVQGRLTLQDIDPSVQAWIGHARQADTEGLRQAIFDAITFSRGVDQ